MEPLSVEPDRYKKIHRMLLEELESAWVYDQLAKISKSESTAETLRTLANGERKHAHHWAEYLDDLSLMQRSFRPPLRARILVLFGRIAGLNVVLPRLRSSELNEIQRYDSEPASHTLADEERTHRSMLGKISEQAGTEVDHGLWSSSIASVFRASLFGLNDGLVSNLSLITGVAGAAIDSDAVLIAGIAGWLAGAFSMGIGEYISVRSQIELAENQLDKERLELELDPDEEIAELAEIYERKGIPAELARELSVTIMKDPVVALETHAREELGINPNDLGSPWSAAFASFLSFSFGAVIPVIPFIFSNGYPAFIAAIISGILTLGLVGAITSLLTGRSPYYAGIRMAAIGLIATAVTFGVGSIIPIDL